MTDPLFDDLPSLLCFARVVETGSFTKAAAALGLSKSVVSTRVAALEERVGEPLLLRTTRRVTVTGAGARATRRRARWQRRRARRPAAERRAAGRSA